MINADKSTAARIKWHNNILEFRVISKTYMEEKALSFGIHPKNYVPQIYHAPATKISILIL